MTWESTVKVNMRYCPVCDYDVLIRFPTERAESDGQAHGMDTEVVCLEVGHQCTGSICPLGAQPPAVMAVRLIRSGMKPVMLRLQSARCDACGNIETFALIDSTHAICAGCGRTVERSRLMTTPSCGNEPARHEHAVREHRKARFPHGRPSR